MFFRQLQTRDASLSYLFGCGSCHVAVAVAVDPVLGDEDWFVAEAAKQDVKITHIIDTHVHADPYSGGLAPAKRTGAPYCLHESNLGQVQFPFQSLQDGQRIEVGNVLVDVLHTPGHTPDSICLQVTDKRCGEAPWFVITGDTLFVGSVGRPDLAGKEVEMAGQIYDSLHSKVLSLPSEVEIFPGHQAGSACGAGISGKPLSPVGFKKRWNPMLSKTRADFIAALTGEIPPRPAEMERMVKTHLGYPA